MKKFILISPKNRTSYNFRGDLIRDIVAKRYEVIVTGPNRENVDRIEELGARFVEIPMNKNGLNPLSDLRYLWQLYRLMRKEKVDVSLGYTIKPVVYGTLAAWMAGVKNRNAMVTGAGYLFISNSFKAKVLRTLSSFLYRIGLGCATHVIFQNNDDLEEFTDRGLCKAGKCQVVNGSGVNMQKFTPSGYPSVPAFFMLSRLLHSKGVMEFLHAAEIVKTKYPHVRFMLLGKLETAMQDAISQEEFAPFVQKGIIEHFPETEDVTSFYGQCSVYVLPSYREGTPRTVLEAMASARPIITTFTPGCKETVEEGRNGFLVPARDVRTLSDRMIYFIEHPDRVREMGVESLSLCRRKFDVSTVNRRMMEIMCIG